jgi:hypothetical protein
VRHWISTRSASPTTRSLPAVTMSWLMKAPCVAPSDIRDGVDWTQPALGFG